MTRVEIKAAIERVCAPAETRRDRAEGPIANLNPTASDWMTNEELAELHRLQLLWSAHPENSTAAARARCKAKRAERRALREEAAWEARTDSGNR